MPNRWLLFAFLPVGHAGRCHACSIPTISAVAGPAASRSAGGGAGSGGRSAEPMDQSGL